MEVVVIIAAIAVGLFLVELLLPTGGLLAFIGAAGLIAAGIVALGDNSAHADAVGAGLIAVGLVSIVGFAIVSRKVVAAHRQKPKGGEEDLIGTEAEVRIPLDPEGQVYVDGALWKARARGGGPVPAGSKVRIESVDGLTLLVSPATSNQ
jgi:membrane-bound serine protease (ClpP class)